MSIESVLRQWAQSPAGKAKLTKEQRAKLRRGGSGSNGPEFYAEKLIAMLRQEIALDGFEYGEYLQWTIAGYNEATGQYEIHVNFDQNALHRDSLYDGPDSRYAEGCDNIAALMNRGYAAKDYVYGEYPKGAGNRIRSRKSRQGAYFMQAAVDHFNAQYAAKAHAVLSSDYEGGRINLIF